MPSIEEYYEPWTYDYETLTNAPVQEHTPVARPRSLLTNKPMNIEWSANWDDNLGGAPELTQDDPVLQEDLRGDQGEVRADLHVLPAADLRALHQPVVRGLLPVRARSTSAPRTASSWSTRTAAAAGGCASPAARTRRSTSTTAPARRRSARSASRGWRSASRRSARRPASAGCATSGSCSTTPTGCSRRRPPRTTQDLYDAQRSIILDPHDPEVVRAAEQAGISRDWIDSAQRSPIYALINRLRGRAPAAPGVPDHADGLVHPAALAGGRRAHRDRPRRRGRRQHLRRHRVAADPGRVPGRAVHRRRHRTSSPACSRSSGRCAPTCAT